MVGKKKYGKMTKPYGVRLEPHEEDTIDFFMKDGKDVEVLAPSGTRKQNSPDIEFDGLVWEMKSPTSSNRRTIENRVREAARQSGNLIFDLRRIKKYPEKAEKEIIRQYEKSSNIKRLIIINSSGKRLDFYK